MKKRIMTGFVMALFAVLLVFLMPIRARAAGAELQIVDPGDDVFSSSGYSLRITDRTTVEFFGIDGHYTGWPSMSVEELNKKIVNAGVKTIYFNPEGVRDKSGFWLYNAGKYQGDPVDIKVTFINGNNAHNAFYVSVGVNGDGNLHVAPTYAAALYLRFDFYRNTNGSRQPLEAEYLNFAITDADNKQVFFVAPQNGAIKSVKVTKNHIMEELQLREDGSFYAVANSDGSDYDLDSTIQLTFENCNSFTYGFARPGGDPEISAEARAAAESILENGVLQNAPTVCRGYVTGWAVGRYDLPSPVKYVSDGDEKMVKENRIGAGEAFEYDVIQDVPDEFSDFYYDSFTIIDELDPRLAVDAVTVYDDSGRDVTQEFSISEKDGTIAVKAKNPHEEWLYPNELDIRISVRPKDGADYAETIINRARCVVERRGKEEKASSNPVSTSCVRYQITTAVVNGTIDPDVSVDAGSDCTIHYQPDKGYRLAKITVDGKAVDPAGSSESYLFQKIGRDHDIRVEYERSLYRIRTEAVHGRIDEEQTDVPAGEDRTIRYEPDEGYYLASVTVDGEEIPPEEAQEAYEFKAVSADHEIRVIFSPAPVKKVFDEAGNEIDGKFVLPGRKIRYEIEARNEMEEAGTYTVSDVLPGGLVFLSAEPEAVLQDGCVLWEAVIDGKSSRKFSILAEVSEAAEGTVLKNRAELSFRGRKALTEMTENPVLPGPLKQVFTEQGEDADGRIVREGDLLVYVITVHNPASAAKTFFIEDAVPAGSELVEAGQGGTVSGSGAEQKLTWRTEVPAGESCSVSFKVRALGKGTVINNEAAAESDGVRTVTQQVINTTPTDPVKKVLNEKGEDLDGKLICDGELMTYAVTFKNPSSAAKTMTVTDRVPEHTELVSVGENGTAAGSDVTWQVLLQPGETGTVTFKVRAAGKGVVIHNQAAVVMDGLSFGTNTVKCAVPDTPVKTVTRGINFDNKQKEDSRKAEEDLDGQALFAGTGICYRIRVSNPRAEEAVFTVQDPIPEGVRFVRASDGGRQEGNTVVWTVRAAAGETAEVSWLAEVEEDAPAKIKNRASAKAENWTEETNETVNYPAPAPVKSVVNSRGVNHNNAAVRGGEILVYRILLENPSPDRQADYIIRDHFPDDRLTFVSADRDGQLRKDSDGCVVRWEVSVPPKKSREVTVFAKVKNGVTENIINYAEADLNGKTQESNRTVNPPSENGEIRTITPDVPAPAETPEKKTKEAGIMTGDGSHMELWATLLTLSAGAFLGLLLRHRNY